MREPCCGVEPQVVRSYNKIIGDNSPDTPTKLYSVLVMACSDPKCPEHGKEYEIEYEQPIGGTNV